MNEARDAERLAALLDGDDASPSSAELAELMATAAQVHRAMGGGLPPAPGGLNRGRAAFISAGVAAAQPGAIPGSRGSWLRWLAPRRTALAMVAVIVSMAAVSTQVMAEHSLPGQWLYPLKRFGEDTRLLLASDEARPGLLAAFAERRAEEARQLAAGDTGKAARSTAPREVIPLRGTPEPIVRLNAPNLVWTAVPSASNPKPAPRPGSAAGVLAPRPTPSATAEPTAGYAIEPPEEKRTKRVRWEGILERMDPDSWVVDGRDFDPAGGAIEGDPHVGDRVIVEAESEDGRRHLIRLVVVGPGAPEELSWQGKITALSDDRWTVDEITFEVNSATKIHGKAEVGRVAGVRANRFPDGRIVALEITILGEYAVDGEGAVEAFEPRLTASR